MRADEQEGDHRRDLAAVIEQHRDEIGRRWLDRARRLVGDRRELSALRDALPDYLAQLAAALRNAGAPGAAGERAWERLARRHALARVRLGFDIDELVAELFVLRRVLADVARDRGALEGPSAEPITALVEGAVAAAVRSYVQARDYQSRRTEAEHVGFITHELRNPLNIAVLGASRLERFARKNAEAARTLAMVRNAHRRLDELIDRVLTVERLEAQGADAHPSDVEFGRLLEEAVRGPRAVAEEKRVELDVRAGTAADAVVHVDPKLAVAALENVVDNAVKFTEEGRVEVDAEDHTDRVEVAVHDNCDGLSPEELRTLFLPFKRGHSGKAGTGLGLAIARRSVEANGGTIRAESDGGRGCRFFLTLPKAKH